jgi:hypothetical protein
MTLTTRPARAASTVSTPQPVLRWIGLCATAEAVGMLAAAGAAKAGQAWLAEPTGTREVAVVLTLAVAAAALGLSMGGLLGGAQARLLRGRVRHPWRWVTASMLGWTPAMAVILAPVQGGLVVLPGRADAKRWWRNLVDPAAVEVLSGGTWSAATGVVLPVDVAMRD